MRKAVLKYFLVTIFWLFCFSFAFGGSGEKNCTSCHQNEKSSCNLTCEQCHLAPQATARPGGDQHPLVIVNPSREQWWNLKCLKCHQSEIEAFKHSLHYSAAGIIDQTRFLWGKNKKLLTTTPEEWKKLRNVRFLERLDEPSALVDHLLSSKCLACHFDARPEHPAKGRKRSAGCAACHIPLDQETGKPLNGHRFQKKVKDETCLTCHSGNTVGGDYAGYFEHDYQAQYATPVGAEPLFGAFQHRLKPDVHQQAGLHCTDCHSKTSVMGSETIVQYEGQNPQVRCETCHGGFNGTAPNKAKAPAFEQNVVSHQSFHRRVSCVACHATWGYQDYGLHLYLDQSKNYEMWEDYRWQGDGEVTFLLNQQLALPATKRRIAFSINKLTGQTLPGIWYKAWSFRRWENPALGVDSDKRIKPIRPLFQYFITVVDSSEGVWLDSQKPFRTDGKVGWSWDVYSPHTVGRKGKSCESCHGNPKAAGLGIRNAVGDSVAHQLTIPAAPVLPGTRLLNEQERRRLLKKSSLYKKWRARELRRKNILKMF